jgi:hypothetical protein
MFLDEMPYLNLFQQDTKASVNEMNGLIKLREKLMDFNMKNPNEFGPELERNVQSMGCREAYLFGGMMMSALYISLAHKDIVDSAQYVGINRETALKFTEDFLAFSLKHVELVRNQDFEGFYKTLQEDFIKKNETSGQGLIMLGIAIARMMGGFHT